MTPSTMLRVLLLLLLAPPATAQTNVGELLDKKAKRLSPDEFRREVVQRPLAGPLRSGGELEVTYTATGFLSGTLLTRGMGFGSGAPIEGDWSIDESGRICTGWRMSGQRGSTATTTPPRCEFWFKLDEKYFVADSDYDRSAKVFARTVVQSSSAGKAQARAVANVGQLLAAGGKPLSAAEFRSEVVQRVLVGPMPSGADIEIMYAGSGAIVGSGYEPGDYRRLHIGGNWTVDDKDRVCSSLAIEGAGHSAPLAVRGCEYWFKLGDSYFLADSNSDRTAKVLVRTFKR